MSLSLSFPPLPWREEGRREGIHKDCSFRDPTHVPNSFLTPSELLSIPIICRFENVTYMECYGM